MKMLFRNVKKLCRPAATRSFSSGGPQDLVVIGGGPGGYVAAIKAAQLGLKTTCVEGRGTLGGTCLNVGCIPSKAMLNNSHHYHEAKHHFESRGIIADNVRIDMEKLLAAKNKAVGGLTQGIEGLFKKNKVTYSKGWGKINSPTSVSVALADGGSETIEAKNILIATGSDVAPLPGCEIDEKMIVSSTGALEFTEVPERLIVIGAGVIGLEMGSVWARLGSKVTFVEFLDGICGAGMDKEITKRGQTIFKKQLGFDFKLGHAVKSATINGNTVSVVAEPKKGGDAITLEAEKVLVSTGRRPYTTGLGLEELGVAMDRGMVTVNDHWQSITHPSIYAIGDVITGPMLAHKAEEEGIAAVEHIINGGGHVNYHAIPGVVYTHPEIANVGYTEEQVKELGIPYNVGKFNFMANSRARCNDDSDGLVKVIAHKETDRLLGCHIIGPGAGEMIAEAVIGIEFDGSAEDFGRTCHAHPTLSEAFKEACMDAYFKPIHS